MCRSVSELGLQALFRGWGCLDVCFGAQGAGDPLPCVTLASG